VHVNRTLRTLSKENAAEVRGRMIHILDWKRLVEMGDFDATYLRLAKGANDTISLDPDRD
jgi:hypothetical protein